MLGVPESVSDLVMWSVAKENAYLGSRFEFQAVVFRYESISFASENHQRVIVERQAQHRPDRLKKPRTGSVGTKVVRYGTDTIRI